MDLDARREELREHIARAYNAVRFSEVIPLVPDPEHRARIIAKAGELFGIPDRNDTGDKIFTATLVGCKLKENTFSSKDEREKAREHIVALLTESALITEARLKGIDYGNPAGEISTNANIEKKDEKPDPVPVLRVPEPSAVPEPEEAPDAPHADPEQSLEAVTIGVRLFDTDDPVRPLPPPNFVSLLQPGPGPKADGRLLSRWLSGVPPHPGEWAIGPRRLDAAGAESLAEIETDLLSGPEQYLAKQGQEQVLSPDAPMYNGSHPTDIMSRVMAAWPDNGLEFQAVRLFRESLGDVIGEFWPEKAADLKSCGATLTIGPELARMLGAALAAERYWLDELGDDTDGSAQFVMGDVNPNGRMEEGLAFRRMAFLGYGCGRNATEALAESLIGLRQALAYRHIDKNPDGPLCGNFDEMFIDDCARPVRDYIYREPEMAPAI